MVSHYVQECRQDYNEVFWIEAGQKETIERDYLQIYQRLCIRSSGPSQDMVKIEDAVLAVKSWFHGQEGRRLLIFDSADSIDNDQDESCIDLRFFLPNTP